MTHTVRLVEMTDDAFDAFMARAVPAFAASKVKNGDWETTGSVARSQSVFDSLLPQKRHTAHHVFRTIIAGDAAAGFLWFAVQPEGDRRVAFLYEIEIFPAWRNQRVGTQAMKLLTGEATALGCDTIRLHVFGFNTGALRFYERLGLRISDYTLQMHIQP